MSPKYCRHSCLYIFWNESRDSITDSRTQRTVFVLNQPRLFHLEVWNKSFVLCSANFLQTALRSGRSRSTGDGLILLVITPTSRERRNKRTFALDLPSGEVTLTIMGVHVVEPGNRMAIGENRGGGGSRGNCLHSTLPSRSKHLPKKS